MYSPCLEAMVEDPLFCHVLRHVCCSLDTTHTFSNARKISARIEMSDIFSGYENIEIFVHTRFWLSGYSELGQNRQNG